MWRLRQHLAEHARNRSQGAVQGVISGGKGDHVYGRSSRRVQTKVNMRNLIFEFSDEKALNSLIKIFQYAFMYN